VSDSTYANSFYHSQLKRYYNEDELRQWIKAGQNGMKTRDGQIERWQKTLHMLETLREEEASAFTLGTSADDTVALERI